MPIADFNSMHATPRSGRPARRVLAFKSEIRNQKSEIPTRSAFTLLELLVVMVIMTLIIGITFPVMSRMVQSNRISTGVNTVSTAAQAIRAYSAKALPASDSYPGSSYAGTALVFTGNDIRLTFHNQEVRDGSGFLGDTSTHNPALHGYQDFTGSPFPQRDPIRLPQGLGVAGILEPGTGSNAIKAIFPDVSDTTKAQQPAFAVRFNTDGQLLPGKPGDNSTKVYYDADPSNNFAGSGNELAVHSVVGLLVFDLAKAKTAGIYPASPSLNGDTVTLSDFVSNDPAVASKADGRAVFFTPYSGAVARNFKE